MPQDKKDKNGEPIEGIIIYQHVTPLVISQDNHSLERYAAIGRDFSISFGVRDTFGFRAVTLDKLLLYKHRYFDKLIPIESWPLLDFSYWFSSFDTTNNTIVWDLLCETNIFEILDQAGIARINEGNDYKYKPGEQILEEDKDLLLSTVNKLLESLFTVQAQLEDLHLQVNITANANPEESRKILLKNVKKVVASLSGFVNQTDLTSFLMMPEEVTFDPVQLVMKLPVGELKHQVQIIINLERSAELCFEAAALPVSQLLNTDEVWEYANVKAVYSSIILKNPAVTKDNPNESSLKTLNKLVSDRSSDKYCLGISSDEERNKCLYLVNATDLKLPFEISIDNKSDFYGIKPYSNNLWSGTYQNKKFPKIIPETYSKIDLDSGLKAVLAKIDEILQPTAILTMAIQEVNKLVAAKKKLISNAVSKPELSDKVEILSEMGATPKEIKEFNHLLLENLNNFYYYDGIIHKEDLTELPVLKSHRLTINFGEETETATKSNYRVISSKPDFRNKPEWSILFDYVGNNLDTSGNNFVNHNFSLSPQVSHIEFNIQVLPGSGEIEKSTWIQLVEPVPLKKLSVKNFPNIIRQYPPIPQIRGSRATQNVIDKSGLFWGKELGSWNYELDLKDNYEAGDKIHLSLKLKAIDTGLHALAEIPESRNFPGFIAYWAKDILSPSSKLNTQEGRSLFIALLHDELTRGPLPLPQAFSVMEVSAAVNFTLTKDENGNWETIGGEEKLSIINLMTEKDKMSLVFSGPNILTNGVYSIRPEIYVTRNENELIRNNDFLYKTDVVTSATWATPHINYHKPIRIKDGERLQAAFDDIPEKVLPFKSTAKYILNLGDVNESLPTIPVMQMEYSGGKNTDIDALFKDYKNGFGAISLTIYNNSNEENGLPILSANTVYKSDE